MFELLEIGEDDRGGVLPLVLCRSKGGPYDDEAFLSGWRLGAIDATLAGRGSVPSPTRSARTNGFRPTSSPWPAATP